jgi:hypothetical protein
MTEPWRWYEYAALVSDLIGFVGALLLAWPFYNTQSRRDKLIALDAIEVSDERTATRIREARQAVALAILNAAQGDYTAGLWGALVEAA